MGQRDTRAVSRQATVARDADERLVEPGRRAWKSWSEGQDEAQEGANGLIDG